MFRLVFSSGIVLVILCSLSCASASKKYHMDRAAHLSFDARLTSYSYPFETKTFALKSQGQDLEMVYMDIAPMQKTRDEKIAVLLHGKNFAGYYWDEIARDLSKKGYRVIVVDQIGFGKSSKPRSYQFSFPQLAINTERLLDTLGIENFHLVGHSMGGMLGVTMAYMFPTQIKKLVLINPIGLETYLDYTNFKDVNFFYEKELSKTKETAIAYQRKNYYDGKWSRNYEKLLEPTFGQLNGPDWDLIAWNNALTYGPIFYEDAVARIEKLKVPVTMILGTRDRTGPGRGWKKEGVEYKLGRYERFGKRFKKILPHIKIIELEGLGHMPQIENYDRFRNVFYPQF